MRKYPFSFEQRYAVYKVFDGRCQWCAKPVDFKNFQVDHVLPESLLKKPDRLGTVLETYGLDERFEINDYENWIPAHSHCNRGKSDKVYEGAGFIRTILDNCAKKKDLAQKAEMMLRREPKKAKLMAEVQAAIGKSLINIQELQDFILKTDVLDSEDQELNWIKWQVEEKIEYQAKIMVMEIQEMIRNHAHDVARDISTALGKHWKTYRSTLSEGNNKRGKYCIAYGVINKVDNRLNGLVIVIPQINGNQLDIVFKNNINLIGEMTQNIEEGVNYHGFREQLRQHYKAELAARLK